MRCLPLNGTAGLQRSAVSGWRREPSPPAMTMASTFLRRMMGSLGRLVDGWAQEKNGSQRRHRDGCTGGLACERFGPRIDAAQVADATAAIHGGITVEELAPMPGARKACAHAVARLG